MGVGVVCPYRRGWRKWLLYYFMLIYISSVSRYSPGLTAPEDATRLRSTELLAVVLQLLPLHGTNPSEQEVAVLVKFYCGQSSNV